MAEQTLTEAEKLQEEEIALLSHLSKTLEQELSEISNTLDKTLHKSEKFFKEFEKLKEIIK